MNGSPNTFDYIIIGAGAAGCVLANRLSTDPAVRVALFEAGPSDQRFPVNLKSALPIGNIFLLPHAKYNWQYQFTGGASVNERSIMCPRGKLLGGCTSVNGSVYIRGHSSDYEEWVALGNEGWGFADVLAAYKKHENRRGAPSKYHDSGGELDVELPASCNPLAHALIDAAAEAGHARNDDFNSEHQDGFGIFELNQRRGVRLSSSRAFLHSVLHRPNLQLFTDTLVERIDVRGGRALGVTVCRDGQRTAMTASAEVVLSAGTVNSPHLLMLSGIGPAAALKRLGISVAQDLPGVGANLQDHATVSISVQNPSAESYALSLQSALRNAYAPLRYLLSHQGMLASNGAESGGFVRSLPDLDRADVQMTFMVGMKESARTIPRRHGFVLHVSVLRPASRGQLELVSADPSAHPLLRPQFLQERADLDTLMRGLKEARRILAMPALARYSGAEISPGRSVTSDTELEAFIRASVATVYHPVGTCKMGPERDPMAVVDARLRVHGIDGLRIADASVMPNIIGGNTAAPAMMIGERAVEFITSPATAHRPNAGIKAPVAA